MNRELQRLYNSLLFYLEQVQKAEPGSNVQCFYKISAEGAAYRIEMLCRKLVAQKIRAQAKRINRMKKQIRILQKELSRAFYSDANWKFYDHVHGTEEGHFIIHALDTELGKE